MAQSCTMSRPQTSNIYSRSMAVQSFYYLLLACCHSIRAQQLQGALLTTQEGLTWHAGPQAGMVRSLDQVRANLDGGGEAVVDARGAGRFGGREKEPRPGVRSGHIPGSVNVPFTQVGIVSCPALSTLLILGSSMMWQGMPKLCPGALCAWSLSNYCKLCKCILCREADNRLGPQVF